MGCINSAMRVFGYLGQLKKKLSASSIIKPQLQAGLLHKWFMYKSWFKLLHLFLILSCRTDQLDDLSPHKKNCGTLLQSVRRFLILFLKHDRLLDARISSSSEFHKDIDDRT